MVSWVAKRAACRVHTPRDMYNIHKTYGCTTGDALWASSLHLFPITAVCWETKMQGSPIDYYSLCLGPSVENKTNHDT